MRRRLPGTVYGYRLERDVDTIIRRLCGGLVILAVLALAAALS